MRYVILSLFMFFVACSDYERNELGKDAAKKPLPTISILEEADNCNNATCSLEVLGDNSINDTGAKFNWLMDIDSNVLFSVDESVVPHLKFQLSNIDRESVKKLMYRYRKNDVTDKELYKTEFRELLPDEDGVYTIAYNVGALGPAVVNSYPEENQFIDVEFYDLSSRKYSYTISFKIKSLNVDVVHIARDSAVAELPYYTSFIPDDSGTFVVDILDIVNTRDRDFVLSGNLDLTQDTLAVVNLREKQQRVINIGRPNNKYPYDIYRWSVVNGASSYRKVSASPTYYLQLLRGDNLEDISYSVDTDSETKIISISNVLVHANESVKLLVFAQFSINDTLLGNHGSKNFFEGDSHYASIGDPMTCNYFYTLSVCTGNDIVVNLCYFAGKNSIMDLKNYVHPECPSRINCSKTLNIVSYPQNTVDLVGRKHSFKLSLDIDVKETGYDGDALQTINKVFDTIEVKDTSYDEALVNYDYVYQGFVL